MTKKSSYQKLKERAAQTVLAPDPDKLESYKEWTQVFMDGKERGVVVFG